MFGPPVIDTRELVAGTFWYTVEEGKRAPVVEAKQGWLLLLPKGSPVISEWKGKIFGKYVNNHLITRLPLAEKILRPAHSKIRKLKYVHESSDFIFSIKNFIPF